MRVCVYVCVKMMDEIGIAVTVRLFDDGHNFSPTFLKNCFGVKEKEKKGPFALRRPKLEKREDSKGRT